MHGEVAGDLSASAFDFLRIVVPAICPSLVGAGRITPVEGATGRDLRNDLDILAGVDAFQMQDDRGRMRSIASRVQWGSNYRTFSIRTRRAGGTETEWSKRVAAFMQPEAGWLLPALTVQAYLTMPKRSGTLRAVGVVRSADLYRYAIKNPKRELENHTDCDRRHLRCAWFMPYSWSELDAAGIKVGIVSDEMA